MQAATLESSEAEYMGYKDDLQRVHAKIDTVVQRLDNAPAKTAPNQWQIASAVLAGFSLIVAVLVAVYTHQSGDMKSAVKIEVSDQLKEPLRQSGVMAQDIAEIKGTLRTLEPLIRETISKKLREAKNISPQELKAAIQVAQQAKVVVNPKDVAIAGDELIRSSKGKNRDAWDAALALISYRTFLNAMSATYQNQLSGDTDTKAHYSLTTPPGFGEPKVGSIGAVPIDQAAIMENIGTNLNKGHDFGNQFLVVEGSGVVLDGKHLKNVILRNTHIVYSGGPLILEGVYFLNCTFDISQQPSGILFADDLLKSGASVSFNAA